MYIMYSGKTFSTILFTNLAKQVGEPFNEEKRIHYIFASLVSNRNGQLFKGSC